MALGDAGRKAIAAGVRNKENFTHGNVSGKWFDDERNVKPRGQLPNKYLSEPTGPIFVVFSYQTPIAWMFDGTWVIPDIKYSATTTNHQNQVRELV